jgi:hypothetical protein
MIISCLSVLTEMPYEKKWGQILVRGYILKHKYDWTANYFIKNYHCLEMWTKKFYLYWSNI